MDAATEAEGETGANVNEGSAPVAASAGGTPCALEGEAATEATPPPGLKAKKADGEGSADAETEAEEDKAAAEAEETVAADEPETASVGGRTGPNATAVLGAARLPTPAVVVAAVAADAAGTRESVAAGVRRKAGVTVRHWSTSS
jgi:hypothetical protein